MNCSTSGLPVHHQLLEFGARILMMSQAPASVQTVYSWTSYMWGKTSLSLIMLLWPVFCYLTALSLWELNKKIWISTSCDVSCSKCWKTVSCCYFKPQLWSQWLHTSWLWYLPSQSALQTYIVYHSLGTYLKPESLFYGYVIFVLLLLNLYFLTLQIDNKLWG